MVRSEKCGCRRTSSSVAEGIEKRPRQAARPERALVAPLLRLHEATKRAEVAALHRPGARRGRHLDGEVGLQPAGEGVVAPLREIEAHRQAGLPRSGARISVQISLYNSFV